MGHRNIQGMALIDEKTIIATEHGPRGGDEINIISTNSLENYGWPISSYGDHYSNYLKETYASVAPLNKNHQDFGFIEPVFYFTYDEINSNGFSQIISNNFDSSIDYFVTSLNGRTIYNLKIYNELVNLTQFIQTKERIRDIVFVEKYNFYVLLQEDTPKISILLQK
jgi:glucose/arabinose dehydrogenase